MKLEAALKHFSPQGMLISDSVKSTDPDRMTGTDLMFALGTTSNRAPFGLAAYLGKAGVSQEDAQQATQALARHAMDTAPALVRKAAGAQFGNCMLVLAQFAFAEYSRSAATTGKCTVCNGSGKGTAVITTRKVTFPWGKPPYWASKSRAVRPSDWEHWQEVTETVSAPCEACKGKGNISARCRCKGTGRVLDRKATKEQGVPVTKDCERCGKRGFTQVSSATVHRAILHLVPGLHQSTWSRNWKPLYEKLVDECNRQERRAGEEFSKITG
ncbi:antitermination protein [Atlantibacter subterraneus]|uniref:antitermination protein n=1 Tax=Atlantibacter subterraneus TaxID=255519 RepID=UPI00289AAFC3|nr:antitermination protein [Atlantibacter subterranea]